MDPRERDARRARSVLAALELQASGEGLEVVVWAANAAGVLVEGGDVTGFIPLSELAPGSFAAVKAEEERLVGGGAAAGPEARRAALRAALVGATLPAQVAQVDAAGGRVILSERAAARAQRARRRRAMEPIPPAALAGAAALVGSVVPATVVAVREFGVFLEVEVQTVVGPALVAGLVHSSEVSWREGGGGGGGGGAPREGQRLQARVLHVDPAKARVFLSIRRAGANPLLETLDSLLASSAPSATAPGGLAGPGGQARQTVDAATDLRPLLGDLEAAARFVAAVGAAPGVGGAALGARLQSRATSQELQVYLAKADAAEAAAEAAGGTQRYRLVVRQGMDVQEVALTAALARGAVRELAARTVAALAAEVEVEAEAAAPA
jgi:predicted RNA-binding protein with RPS1 domain